MSAFQSLIDNWLLPKQWRHCSLADMPLLALDLELTSLDIEETNITSVGWITAKNRRINLGTAYHQITTTKKTLGQSPTIHGITQEQIKQGDRLADVLDTMIPMMEHHILVLHHASLDLQVIKRACRNLKIRFPTCISIDTLQMCRYLYLKTQQPIKTDSLTLSSCRERYALPQVNVHNALDDSLATIELYFACQSELGLSKDCTIKSLRHTGAIRIWRE